MRAALPKLAERFDEVCVPQSRHELDGNVRLSRAHPERADRLSRI
jgi:hypothetical protein